MTQIILEVGKTYLTRNGHRVSVEAETTSDGTFRMRCKDAEGRTTWRSHKGRFDRHPHRLDLVREAG